MQRIEPLKKIHFLTLEASLKSSLECLLLESSWHLLLLLLNTLSALTLVSSDCSTNGIDPGPQQAQTMSELSCHRQQSVGHIGAENILA